MSVFFEQILKLDEVKEPTIRDTNDHSGYKFRYKRFTLSATQRTIEDLTLSRIIYAIKSEKLLQRTTKEEILEDINAYNKRINTLKICLQKIDDEAMYIKFSIEYGIKDEVFKYIDLEEGIKLVTATSVVFLNKYFNDDISDEGPLLNE